jgi:hypothetical protein
MLTENQAKQLYTLSTTSSTQWGFCRSFATTWVHNVRSQELYCLACEVAGAKSLMDAEILPTIFSSEGRALIESTAKNEYYFWQIASKFALLASDSPPVEAVKAAIRQIRNANTRIAIDRYAALSGSMTPQQICQFTAIGLLLWSDSRQNWVLNPLWCSAKEYAELAIAPSCVEA